MIAVAELRIGNSVDTSVGYQVVHFITPEGVHLGNGDIRSPEQLHPIELTEEVLLACGFTWSELLKHWTATRVGGKGLYLMLKGDRYPGFSFQIGTDHYKVVKHLHTLQNLFFALTGDELIISTLLVAMDTRRSAPKGSLSKKNKIWYSSSRRKAVTKNYI